jgi:hypothetical protein
MVTMAQNGDALARHWIDGVVAPGAKRALLREAVDTAGSFGAYIHPELQHGTRVEFKFTFFSDKPGIDVEQVMRQVGYSADESRRIAKRSLYATAFLMIWRSGHQGLMHKCQLADCGKIFFGDVRRRWCTNKCGSKARVRAKRKKDE